MILICLSWCHIFNNQGQTFLLKGNFYLGSFLLNNDDLYIGKISENNSKIGKFIYSHNVSAYNGLFQV